jgi:hypothetical protein
MRLKDILQKLVEEKTPILLCCGNQASEPGELLTTLPEPTLLRQAHLTPGLYIAEINDKGYLGRVLYKVQNKE